MTSAGKALYFDSVDILRGFAALSVVIYHVIEHVNWQAFPASGPLLWFRVGWMGVDLFFVISGFVIGLSAFSEIDRSGPVGFRRPFMERRLIRIVPLHYLTMLVFIVFIAPELLFQHFWINLFAHLAFVHNWDIRLSGSINGSNWSLGTEMQFYVLMLLLAPWLRQGKVVHWLLALVGVAWAWRYGVTQLVSPSAEFGVFPIFVAATQLPGMLDEFAAGLLLARLVRLPWAADWMGRPLVRLGIVLAAVLATWATMSVYFRHASYWDKVWMVTGWRSLLSLAFGLILLATICIPIRGRLRTLLSPLFYLGTISYGIYLWHLPILLALKRLSWIDPGLLAVLCVCLTCVFAAVSWHFFESPLIQRFSNKVVPSTRDGMRVTTANAGR